MRDLPPALAKLLAEQYQSPNGDGLGHRYEPDTMKPKAQPSQKRRAMIAAVQASRPEAFPRSQNTRSTRRPVPIQWRCLCERIITASPCEHCGYRAAWGTE